MSRDDAVAALFTAHHAALLRLAGLLLRDGDMAEDVVQDAFARFYVAYPRLRESDAALPYLRRTVVNLCHSRLRRLGVARSHRGEVPAHAAPADTAAGLRDDQVAVLRALSDLSDRQRTCLMLRFYEDLTETEIAAVLGISPNSVKTHVQRGMAALGERLEEYR
jgi:RNA polymerase sigma-70 factor (sigma-E family)